MRRRNPRKRWFRRRPTRSSVKRPIQNLLSESKRTFTQLLFVKCIWLFVERISWSFCLFVKIHHRDRKRGLEMNPRKVVVRWNDRSQSLCYQQHPNGTETTARINTPFNQPTINISAIWSNPLLYIFVLSISSFHKSSLHLCPLHLNSE